MNISEVAKLLLQHNAKLKAKVQYSPTPLAIAAYSNSVEIDELFFQHDANIEAKDESKHTFLYLAAWKNNAEIKANRQYNQ